MTTASSSPNSPAGRQNELNQYWIPSEGIAREVIQADLTLYLGPEAICRPGKKEDADGYYYMSYRNLTSAMIADLKESTKAWKEEQRDTNRYELSAAYRSRRAQEPVPGLGGNTTSSTVQPRYGEAAATSPYRQRSAYGSNGYIAPTVYATDSMPRGYTGGTAGYSTPTSSAYKARPGYYIASDRREYPISQQPGR